ncbi:MAG TPA: TIGR03435 family protein [Candidatus Aquilonibacter sp.]|nr:TIGR03435 family protein [Candidatus Aquilonibacter sp.]
MKQAPESRTAPYARPIILFAAALLIFRSSQLRAQSAPDDWEKAAGGKMAFDVASIKARPWDPSDRSPSNYAHMNFLLTSDDAYAPTGGLLYAQNLALVTYIIFAYKLTPEESVQVYQGIPKWGHTEHFDIEARGPANATKDQMRLMMQSLLADRFKLAVHWEEKQVPVFFVMLAKARKTGPQLQPSPKPPCPSTTDREPPANPTGAPCARPLMGMKSLPDGERKLTGHDLPMQRIVGNLRFWPGTEIDRPLVDGTGLSGIYDFTLVWSPDTPLGQTSNQDVSGPSYIEALRDQLGLKLVAGTGPSHELVIDHIEEPSPN